ncbi:hypothetical protein AB0M46_16870 [Dactylosporangium sp. NPDC051485]|uniref:hypothetical protein n=1 Tax=Dactylosporangium sp. NPDC051485 TaxID=3154846 RepID=UPI003432A7D4
MDRFAGRLAELGVTASSPDGGIGAEARADDYVRVWFVSGAFRRYAASTLSYQLARLAVALWAKFRREYLHALDAHLGGLRDDGYGRPEERIYWERFEQLVVRGASDRGEVRVQSRALVSWDFDIDEGVLRTLTEAEFLAALRAATSDLLADYRAQLTLLQDEVLGMGLPKWFRTEAVQGVRNG